MTNPATNWFIRSRLKMRQIVVLLHLYEQRSVLRAAEAAGITQPAASKLLGELEDALGVKLFDRHARGVEPTWYGEILVRHARAALSEISRAQDEIIALKKGLTGQASIGTVMNPAASLIPVAIAAIKQAHPGILINVEMDYSRPLIVKLLDGQLDIVIGRILDSHGVSELDFERLSDEPHAVIARAAHPFAKKRNLALTDLLQLGWVLQPPGSVMRGRLDTMLLEQGLKLPSNVVETSALPVIIALLQETDMISVVPERSVLPYCEAGMLTTLPIRLGVNLDAFGIITRRHLPLSPGAEIVLKMLRETAAKVYPAKQR